MSPPRLHELPSRPSILDEPYPGQTRWNGALDSQELHLYAQHAKNNEYAPEEANYQLLADFVSRLFGRVCITATLEKNPHILAEYAYVESGSKPRELARYSHIEGLDIRLGLPTHKSTQHASSRIMWAKTEINVPINFSQRTENPVMLAESNKPALLPYVVMGQYPDRSNAIANLLLVRPELIANEFTIPAQVCTTRANLYKWCRVRDQAKPENYTAETLRATYLNPSTGQLEVHAKCPAAAIPAILGSRSFAKYATDTDRNRARRQRLIFSTLQPIYDLPPADFKVYNVAQNLRVLAHVFNQTPLLNDLMIKREVQLPPRPIMNDPEYRGTLEPAEAKGRAMIQLLLGRLGLL